MNRAERLRILGPEAADRFAAIGASAPPPTPELLALLRRIFAQAATHSESRRAA